MTHAHTENNRSYEPNDAVLKPLCTYVYTYIYIYIRTYIHTYIHIYTNKNFTDVLRTCVVLGRHTQNISIHTMCVHTDVVAWLYACVCVQMPS